MIDHNILFRAQPSDGQRISLNNQRLEAGRFGIDQQRQEADRAAQLRELFAQDGSAILNNDRDALARLAALDPGLAQKAMQQAAQLDMQQQRLGLAKEGQEFNQGLALRREGRADAAFNISARQQFIEQERKDTERALAALTAASTPERWDQIAQRMAPELVGQFDQRDALMNEFLGVKEALKLATPEKAPSGYRWNGDALEAIPGGPGDKPVEPNLTGEAGLRKEFTALTKDFRAVRDAYTKVRGSASNPSAAGDMALIFNFMKMLDPGSVVREGEFATAQNAAGVPDRVQNIYNNLLKGERLNPAQREDFMSTAKTVFEGQNQTYERDLDTFRRIAESAGLDPERTIPGFSIIEQDSAKTDAGPTQQDRRARARAIAQELIQQGVTDRDELNRLVRERVQNE